MTDDQDDDLEVVDYIPGPMAVVCPTCEAPAVCNPHGYTLYNEPSEGPPERWTLLQCPKGHTLLVLQNEWSGTSFDDDDPYRMYPAQDRQLSSQIPEALRDAHEEARKCFRSKAWIGHGGDVAGRWRGRASYTG